MKKGKRRKKYKKELSQSWYLFGSKINKKGSARLY